MSGEPSEFLRRRRLPGPGTIVRIALLLAWLGIYGHHASGHLAIGLGLIERRDLRAVLLAHLDHRYRYEVLVGAEPRGHLNLSYGQRDTDYDVSLELQLHSLDWLEVMLPAESLPMLGVRRGGLAASRLQCRFTTVFDFRFQLARIKVEGRALGMDLGFTGDIASDGLRGLLVLPQMGIRDHPVLLPQLNARRAASLQPALAMPPGLRSGERFLIDSVDPKPGPPWIDISTLEVVVRGRDPGTATLLQVDLRSVRGDTVARLLVDERGAVHRAEEPGGGMSLRLLSIHRQGELQWSRGEQTP